MFFPVAFILTALMALVSTSIAANIIQSNDDGWAELYLRTLNTALVASSHRVLLSAPAENKSGTSSRDKEPKARSKACQYSSCPEDTNARWGVNTTTGTEFWVNAYPATSVRYAIDEFAPEVWGANVEPDMVITGPNVGANYWLGVPFSGTVGAACHAVDRGIPAIAFSAYSGPNAPWNMAPIPDRALLYADLAANLTNRILESGKPYLPRGVFLNVNFPKYKAPCTDAAKFKWVLTRIYPGLISPPDTETCGSTRLPTEREVIHSRRGCYVSISVGDASDKTTVDDQRQKVVLDKLSDMLSCF
ncbi:hypothetical protein CDD82_5085 [Ophiocordyceps australis]|uniref:Survival protein SurE-like phosphatase/nucleotidase domain-containing protein n=1 Tax=Ophiocordyceps australis TaxID=1399860 RepID=A0A2C5XJ06_9HYPO|nr:hypothetical protein CDD82_5085 [Ophiocordyceps australis]